LTIQERAARGTVLCERRYRVAANTGRLEKLYAVAEITCSYITYVCVGNS